MSKLTEEERKARAPRSQGNNQDDPTKVYCDQRVKPQYDCVNFFKLDTPQKEQKVEEAKEGMVLQCTRSGKHLNRFLLIEAKKISKLKEELTEEELVKFKRKKDVIEREEVDFKLQDQHGILKLYLFEKQYLRKNVNLYLNRVENIQMDFKSREFGYFPNVFTIFPMNIDLLIHLSIFQKCLLYQIRDSFAIHHFKTFCLPKLFKYKAPRQNNGSKIIERADEETYSYTIDLVVHFLCKHANQVQQAIQQKNGEFALAYNSLASLNSHEEIRRRIAMKQPRIASKFDKFFQQILDAKLSELIKAFTSTEYSSNDKRNNLERYEFLGDTVLKCLATTQTYFAAKTKMENELHVRRAGIIFNKNLTRIAIKKEFFKYILADKMNFSQPLGINYEGDAEDEENEEEEDKKKEENKNEEEGEQIRLKRFYRRIKGKTFADCIESLVGMFYWETKDMSFCQYLLYSMDILEKPDLTFNHQFQPRQTQLESVSPVFQHLQKLESILNYKFQNVSLLFQALTLSNFEAASLLAMRQSQSEQSQEIDKDSLKSYNFSNQRLEFLGDAVLDMIVVEQLFKKFPHSEPGELTEKKRSVVQNKTLCLVNLEKGFYKYVFGDLDKDQVNLKKIIEDKSLFRSDIYSMYSEVYDQSLIKTLGDVVESIIGAIFIDNDLDYNATKEIVMNFMSEYIDLFPEQVKSYGYQDVLKNIFGQEVEIRKVKKSVENNKTKFEFRNKIGDVVYFVYATDKSEAIDLATIQKQNNQAESS